MGLDLLTIDPHNTDLHGQGSTNLSQVNWLYRRRTRFDPFNFGYVWRFLSYRFTDRNGCKFHGFKPAGRFRFFYYALVARRWTVAGVRSACESKVPAQANHMAERRGGSFHLTPFTSSLCAGISIRQ